MQFLLFNPALKGPFGEKLPPVHSSHRLSEGESSLLTYPCQRIYNIH